MNPFLVILLLFSGAAESDADGESQSLFARVIDSNIERIPEQTVVPSYPRKARRDRVEGEVRVCFEIDRKGRPRRIAVRNSSNRAFEKPSVKAVRASRFKPLDDAESVPAIKSCRTFIFSLEPVDEDSQEDDEE